VETGSASSVKEAVGVVWDKLRFSKHSLAIFSDMKVRQVGVGRIGARSDYPLDDQFPKYVPRK
jgi:hypothetical protein